MGQSRRYEGATSADLPALGRMISHAFGTEREGGLEWIAASGLTHVRVMRESAGGEAVGCLLKIPMGQFFGGNSVPMVGIAGVAVPPEARGRGVAREMMEECVRELHREGAVLSALYCSTQALYRQVGFEAAGSRFLSKVPTSRLIVAGADGSERSGAALGKSGTIVPIGDAEMAEVKECRQRFARHSNGETDRGEYLWKRVHNLRGMQFYGFAVRDGHGAMEGYVFIAHERQGTALRHGLVVSDVAFCSPAAGRRIVRFLADFEPTVETVTLSGGAVHPLLMLLTQQRYTVEFKDFWMIRLVNVERALAARGYGAHVSAAVTLEVEDAVVPENAGVYTLRVQGGGVTVSRRSAPGGTSAGLVRCGVRGLAAMYSGFMSPRDAARLGWCDGDEAGLSALGAMFGDGAPSSVDTF